MKRTLILPLLILCSAAVVDAETYKWTDDQGVVSFTDDPALIPSRYRSKALRVEDITIRSPQVQQELREQEEKMRQDKLMMPRIVTTPGSVQSTPAPPSMKQPIPAPLGDQPKPTPPGMTQPTPAPLGDQPKPTLPGMTQPTPAPLGDQPKPTLPGMEQPKPAQ